MYNSNVHHRKSVRIKDYDYSANGIYFITICTYNRAKILSKIVGARRTVPRRSKNRIIRNRKNCRKGNNKNKSNKKRNNNKQICDNAKPHTYNN